MKMEKTEVSEWTKASMGETPAKGFDLLQRKWVSSERDSGIKEKTQVESNQTRVFQ